MNQLLTWDQAKNRVAARRRTYMMDPNDSTTTEELDNVLEALVQLQIFHVSLLGYENQVPSQLNSVSTKFWTKLTISFFTSLPLIELLLELKVS